MASRIARGIRKATGFKSPELAPTLFRVRAPAPTPKVPPSGLSFAESSFRVPIPRDPLRFNNANRSSGPAGLAARLGFHPLESFRSLLAARPPWETDPAILPPKIDVTPDFPGIPLYGYNRHTNVPSSFVQYLPEGETIQVLPYHYRVPVEDQVEDIVRKRRSLIAEREGERFVDDLESTWGKRKPLEEILNEPPKAAKREEPAAASDSTSDSAVSKSAETSTESEKFANAESSPADSNSNSVNAAIADPPLAKSIPKPRWVPVRIAPIDMKIDDYSPIPGAATPKLEYGELAMPAEYLDKLYLEPTYLQLDDKVEARFDLPPAHLLSDGLDKLEEKLPSLLPSTRERRINLHDAWTKERINVERKNPVTLNTNDADSAGSSGAASQSATSDAISEPLPTTLVGSPAWKRQLRQRYMFRSIVMPILRSIIFRKNDFRRATDRGSPAAAAESSSSSEPASEKPLTTLNSNWLRMRIWIDDSLVEWRDGQVGGPAFGGKLMMLRPPGAVPERMEISAPFSYILSGTDRWERSRWWAKLAVFCSVFYTSCEFALNRYRFTKVNWDADQLEHRMGEGAIPSDSELESTVTATSAYGLNKDNPLFRKYRRFRHSDTGKKYNWRQCWAPFCGFQFLTVAFVAPFSTWATWWFLQNAYSSFFVTFSFCMVLWHDLFNI